MQNIKYLWRWSRKTKFYAHKEFNDFGQLGIVLYIQKKLKASEVVFTNLQFDIFI